MSLLSWSKQWMFDNDIEIPKTTKWRRSICRKNGEFEFVNTSTAVDNIKDDGHRNVSLDIYSDSNTSPLKRQKISQAECCKVGESKTLYDLTFVDHIISQLDQQDDHTTPSCSTTSNDIADDSAFEGTLFYLYYFI